MARGLGIPLSLIVRAREIFSDENAPINALRFLSIFIRLKFGWRIPGFPYHLANQLNTDKQRARALQALELGLGRQKSNSGRQSVQIQLLRLEGQGYQRSEARDLVRAIAEEGVQQIRQQHIEAKSTRTLMKGGLTALDEATTLFAAHNKRYFIVSGTLLGAVRDNNFVDNDNDVDLGVFADEVSRDDLGNIFARSSFLLVSDQRYHQAYQHKSGVMLEFFFTERSEEVYTMRNFDGIVEWRFSPFELKPLTFMGHELLAPAEPEVQLTENYGNWRAPALFYDHLFDVPCARFTRTPEAAIYLAKRLGWALKTGNRFSAEQCALELRDRYGIDYCYLFPNL